MMNQSALAVGENMIKIAKNKINAIIS